ncbi:ImmA/IrrE family metallo-endopeptidase [Lichenihabitans sp. Uapishka_5]|uniref:ImmA/IrrE family metallo-endopeptidase n=1 Tax=Lichenihabitans sp. Uapishka_5 TaxID=3037302 RepID=UPI0029E81A30|nr:ImmA/IrrE family metallo-endopeptidase [Lichenihabitans sp. Uapishka_5]MDX7951259.1 ImmA/IrrE family metallo-endopeptidase [Lichenihabitans sp. Uapishka_5]
MMHEPAFDRDWFSKPADSLLAMMQRRRLTPSDVARELPGGLATLRGLLIGDVAIDEAVAGGLAATVGGTTTFWLRRQGLYEACLGRVVDAVLASDSNAWLATVPVPASAGPTTRGRTADDRRRAAVERRLVFFDVNGAEAWSRRYGTLRCETRFRESAAFEVHPGATAMWLRQGELEAALVSTDVWDPNGLSASIGEIVKLSRIGQPVRFLPRLRVMLARFGVALVVVRAPEGCRASGAARMLSPTKAMVLASFRHRSDDHFWFTLLHEIGHLLLHGGRTFIDEEGASDDEPENEANAFAADHIIPQDLQQELASLHPDYASVIRFSLKLRIAPGLTVGQMQHRGLIQRNWLNKLRRTWTWDEIDPALD